MKMNIAACLTVVTALSMCVLADDAPCMPDGVLDVLRFPCTPHHIRRFLGARVETQTQINTHTNDVGNVMYGFLTILITSYRSRHFIPESVIQRTEVVPVYQDPRICDGEGDLETMGHAVAVYFVELHAMQLMETRLRVELYETHTYEGVLRICQQTLLTLLCRLDVRLVQAGNPGFHDISLSSLDDVTCPETHIVEYTAKTIHTLENMREYFRLMAMI